MCIHHCDLLKVSPSTESRVLHVVLSFSSTCHERTKAIVLPPLFSFTKAVGFGTLGARRAQEVSDGASIHTSLSMWSHPRGFPHSTCHVLTNDDQAKGDFGHLQETSASLQKGIPFFFLNIRKVFLLRKVAVCNLIFFLPCSHGHGMVPI